MKSCQRRVTRAGVLVMALCLLGFPAPSSGAQLDLVTNGPGSIVATIPEASAPESARVVCAKVGAEDPYRAGLCPAYYLPGRVVTLTAEPMAIGAGLSSFGVWSDDRCPPTPVCELPIDSDSQTVAASFSPQRVEVETSSAPQGPGRVTSMPPGLTCDALPNAPRICTAEFPLFTTVDLIAEGAGAEWLPGGCDTRAGATCSVTADLRRVAQVRFPAGFLGGRGGGFGVHFHVAKDGSGSGLVQGERLNCGEVCEDHVGFGTRDTLVALPDAGSRFARWRGACGENPRCSLAVGPVTRVTAVFERAPAAGSTPPPAPPPAPPPSPPPGPGPGSTSPFVAVVDGVGVRGARPRQIRFAVRVSARASIRGVLETARGDRVTARTWKIPRGRHVRQLAVPRRAPRGTYVLRITARDGHGHVKRLDRRVRLRR